MPPTSRRLAPCLLALAALVAACGGGAGPAATAGDGGSGGGSGNASGTGGSQGGAGAPAATPPAGGGGTADGAIATVDALDAALESAYGTADWFGDLTAITEETWLGARVVVVHTTLSVSDPDPDAINRKRTEIGDALAALDQAIAPNLAIIDGDVTLAPLGSGGLGSVSMGDAFALPERPTTARAVQDWLQAVYGPGGVVPIGPDEAWLGSLTEVRYEDPGWGTGEVLWLATTLPTYRSLDAQLLQKALLTTGSPLLEDWYLETADGSGASGSAGGLKDLPVGGDGFYYLPPGG
jgi:hypothetical protein